MDTIDVRGGDWLFEQGDPAHAVYFVVRGRLQVWVSDENGANEDQLLGENAPARASEIGAAGRRGILMPL